jgi:hypothetical protein
MGQITILDLITIDLLLHETLSVWSMGQNGLHCLVGLSSVLLGFGSFVVIDV